MNTRLTEAFHQSASSILRRRHPGKIAALPAPIREQINLMLRDGLTYAAIIARLGDAGKHLNKDNLSRWRKAEHQDWLAEQTWLQATAGRPQPPPEVKHIALLLHQFDSDTLRDAISRRPDKLVPHFNLLAKFLHLSGEDPPSS